MKNWISIPRGDAIGSSSDHWWNITEWAVKNCPTYITNDYGVKGGRTTAQEQGNDYDSADFFFGKNEQGQQDMILFALKWL